jgi:rubrerythrin
MFPHSINLSGSHDVRLAAQQIERSVERFTRSAQMLTESFDRLTAALELASGTIGTIYDATKEKIAALPDGTWTCCKCGVVALPLDDGAVCPGCDRHRWLLRRL